MLVAGCAAGALRVGQALDVGETSLASIQNALVVVTFDIESPVSGQYFRASDLWGTNTATGQEFRFPLFSNFIMGTKDVPHTIDGNRLTQTAMLDLPAGSYSLERIDFITLEDHFDQSVDIAYINRPYPSPVLEVGVGGVQYFGRVELRIIDVQQVGSEHRIDVRIVPRGVRPADVEAIKTDYPALAGTEIQRKRIEL
jgi:hypothetical protein